MPELAVLDHDTVLAAVSPQAAIEATREAFLRHHRGEWVMPAKVYLQSPPYGDFRAMPARGGDLALLKWITSFPGNPAQGLPTVSGVVCLSDARTGVPLAILDARAVTALRTGAVAAVATQALARLRARAASGSSAAGCTAPGPRAASPPPATTTASASTRARRPPRRWRPSSAAGRRRPAGRARLRRRLLRDAGRRGRRERGDLRPGQHLNMLGADGSGKAEASVDAVVACELFCDEWAQASHGGELTGAVEAGLVTREQVTTLGAVLAGDAPGRSGPAATTLFDSTGLAIQDLAVAAAALRAARAGEVQAGSVSL